MSIYNDPGWVNLDPRLKITEIRDDPAHHSKETYLVNPLHGQQREKLVNVRQTKPINVQHTKKPIQDIPSTSVNVIDSSLRNKPQETPSVKATGIDKAFKSCFKKLGKIDHEFISHRKDIYNEKMAALKSELLSIEREEHPALNKKLEQTEQKHKETLKLIQDQFNFKKGLIEKKYEEDEQEINDVINIKTKQANTVVGGAVKDHEKKYGQKQIYQEDGTPIKQVFPTKLYLKRRLSRLFSGGDRRKKVKENMTNIPVQQGPDPLAVAEHSATLSKLKGGGVKKRSRPETR